MIGARIGSDRTKKFHPFALDVCKHHWMASASIPPYRAAKAILAECVISNNIAPHVCLCVFFPFHSFCSFIFRFPHTWHADLLQSVTLRCNRASNNSSSSSPARILFGSHPADDRRFVPPPIVLCANHNPLCVCVFRAHKIPHPLLLVFPALAVAPWFLNPRNSAWTKKRVIGGEQKNESRFAAQKPIAAD